MHMAFRAFFPCLYRSKMLFAEVYSMILSWELVSSVDHLGARGRSGLGIHRMDRYKLQLEIDQERLASGKNAYAGQQA